MDKQEFKDAADNVIDTGDAVVETIKHSRKAKVLGLIAAGAAMTVTGLAVFAKVKQSKQ